MALPNVCNWALHVAEMASLCLHWSSAAHMASNLALASSLVGLGTAAKQAATFAALSESPPH